MFDIEVLHYVYVYNVKLTFLRGLQTTLAVAGWKIECKIAHYVNSLCGTFLGVVFNLCICSVNICQVRSSTARYVNRMQLHFYRLVEARALQRMRQ